MLEKESEAEEEGAYPEPPSEDEYNEAPPIIAEKPAVDAEMNLRVERVALHVQKEKEYLANVRNDLKQAQENIRALRACAAFLRPIVSAHSIISSDDSEYGFGKEPLDAARSVSKRYSQRESKQDCWGMLPMMMMRRRRNK